MTDTTGATQDAVVGLVVTGDNHLSPALPRLSPARRQERRAWLRRGFRAAVDAAIERQAALFINTGDLFDSPAPTNQDRAFVAQQLRRLREAGIVCIAISGNHDTPRMQTEHGGEAPQQVYAALDDLHYLAAHDTLDPLTLELNGLRVAVVGLSNNPVAAPGSDPLASATWSPSAEEALAQADVALVALHAAIEGLSRPNEGERTVTQSSLSTLPDICRLVVAGHIHRYTRQRMGEREVVVVGATEQMEFGAQSGAPGFVWVEMAREGVRHVEHIRTPAQPRVDISLHTERLWSDAADSAPAPELVSADESGALAIIRSELEAACTRDTMVRLRLSGALTREQYHQLALREVITLGQQIAFSLDVDTSGLTLTERALTLPNFGGRPEAISPERMIRLVVEEALQQERIGAPGQPSPDDVRAAGDLLLARLRAHEEEGS
ncbi:MAG TPA: metallophosphoesterase [Ktedonobacterales bacterium]|nr:metallophosphoesterase [Ktedonobacterales bacterium]